MDRNTEVACEKEGPRVLAGARVDDALPDRLDSLLPLFARHRAKRDAGGASKSNWNASETREYH